MPRINLNADLGDCLLYTSPEDITIGTLAGAGTLGLLIPPSIIMIVYGVSAEVSIAQLFIAGVLPGVMLALLFSGYLVLWALFNPALVPPADAPMGLGAKLRESRHLIPVMLLIAAVLGSICLLYTSRRRASTPRSRWPRRLT